MGHDHHFLSRLDRVEDQHLGLALGLYRDDALVRLVLAYHARFIPEAAPRVAIALEDSGDGPHIIVARNGRFVTCLGKGMMPAVDDPLITREQLDRCTAGLEAFRHMRGEDGAEEKGQYRGMLKRLVSSSHAFSREDMRELVMVSPIIEGTLERMYGRDVAAFCEKVYRVGLFNKAQKRHHDELRIWWQATWRVGVLAPVLALQDPREWSEAHRDACLRYGWFGVAQGVMPVAMRSLWASARIGARQFGACEATIDGRLELTNESCITAVGSLITAAVRYPDLEQEVRRILSPQRAEPLLPDDNVLKQALLQLLRRGLRVMDNPQHYDDEFVAAGRRLAVERKELGFRTAEEVPEDIARLVALHWERDYFIDVPGLDFLLSATPWLARARPEELFFPKTVVDRIDESFSADRALQLSGPLRRLFECMVASEKADRKPRGPGPNEPCACGSGKKYKKCCGSVVVS